MKMKSLCFSVIALTFISQIHESHADQSKYHNNSSSSNMLDIILEVTETNPRSPKNVVTINTKLVILKDLQKITDFEFTESFNLKENKLIQVSGISELQSSGFSVFRHWEKSKITDDGAIALIGWIILCNSGQITEDDLIGLKFNAEREGDQIFRIKGKTVLIRKTNVKVK